MLKSLVNYLIQDLGVQPNVAVKIILSLFTFSLGFIITWTASGISKWVNRKNIKRVLKCSDCSQYLTACKTQKNQNYYYKCRTTGCNCNKREDTLHEVLKA